jgi:hypothetical protein
MRVQFIAAVILGLILSPAPVFGCTCAAPPLEVKTASELAAWTRADEAGPDSDGYFCVTDRIDESLTSFVYFPGVTDLSEATAIDITPGHAPSDLAFNIPAQATFSVSGTVSNSDNPQLPAEVKVMLMSASQPLLAYTVYAAASGSFVFNQVLPGEYWAIVTVDPGVELKWSTRKAGVEVVGDITHLSLELITN